MTQQKPQKPQKLNEIDLEEFENVLQKTPEIAKMMEQVPKRAGEIIRDVYAKKGEKQILNAMNMVKNRLKQELSLTNSIEVEALLAGTRDKKGTSFPTQFALMAQGGKTWAAKHFGVKVPDADGKPVELPPFAIVKVKIAPNEEFGGWDLLMVKAMKNLGTDAERIINVLNEAPGILNLAKIPEIPRKPKSYPLVVFKAKIRRIRPTKNFSAKDEDALPWPILVDGIPVMWINTESEDRVDANITLEARGKTNGDAYIMPDLVDECKEAMEFTDDPNEQAKYVDGVFSGREVVVVGQLTSLSDAPSDFVDWRCNVSAFALIEVPQELDIKPKNLKDRVDDDKAQKMLAEEEEPGKEETTEETETKKEEKPTKKEESKPSEEEPATKPAKEEKPKKRKKKEEETPEISPAEAEVLPVLKRMAGTLGVETIGDMDIDTLMKGKTTKKLVDKFTASVVKSIWEKHKDDEV